MTTRSTARRTVGILIFDGVEVLDFAGPFEVFAGALPAGEVDDQALFFKVVTIATELRLIDCAGGLLVQPHFSLENHPPLDILVIPGGNVGPMLRNRGLLDWIVREDKQVEVLASVCTGAVLLAETGLLDGGPATTHWASVGWMRTQYPGVNLSSDQRVVDRGHVLTAAGVSAGIDMALYLVARLHGAESATWIARLMEYAWNPDLSQNPGSRTERPSQSELSPTTTDSAPPEIAGP
jgi:transcriptional regulator GlxA family with amidase domain